MLGRKKGIDFMRKIHEWIICAIFIISCTVLMACGSNGSVAMDSQGNQVNSDSVEAEVAVARPMEITDVSDTEKEIYVYSGELKLYGKLFLPEGEGPFPVVVLSSGAGMPFSQYKDIAKKLTDNGIACVCFDFAGAINPSRSEGSALECSVLTEAADLAAVTSSVKELEYIDGDNVFLWGHSLGGFVAAYVGCKYPDMVKGMLLAEPSFQFHDQIRELFPDESLIPEISTEPFYCGDIFYKDALSFDIYDMMPSYNGDVIIYAGTKTPSLGAEYKDYLERAEKTFPSAKLVFIDGADHQFVGDSRKIMIDDMLEYINGQVAH